MKLRLIKFCLALLIGLLLIGIAIFRCESFTWEAQILLIGIACIIIIIGIIRIISLLRANPSEVSPKTSAEAKMPPQKND